MALAQRPGKDGGETYRLYIPRTNEISIRYTNTFISQVTNYRMRIE